MLASRIGRQPNEGELYMAHFFGPAGASKLIQKAGEDPTANAANLFPGAARANRSVFYDKAGHARSVAGVYGELTRRYQIARASPSPGMARAVATSASPFAPVTQPQPVQDTAGVTQALAAANVQPIGSGDNSSSAFHSLFSTEDRRGAVAGVVSELWGTQASAAAASNTSASDTLLNLFQDTRPNVRGLFDGST
jgi:hypothetical protein